MSKTFARMAAAARQLAGRRQPITERRRQYQQHEHKVVLLPIETVRGAAVELEALAKWHESRHELLPLPLAQVLERLREAVADANRVEAREAEMEEHRARWAAEVAAKAADPR